MLNNIKILDTIRYTNSKTTEFPYEISSQLEGFNNNVFYFKKHPNETYVENLFVKSLVDSSDKFNMQIILDSTLNALLKNNYEYKTAISIIDRMIINVKTESGSFGRRAGYYLFKYNPIFMLSAILTDILFRKEILKRKQAFDFSEGWINIKINEYKILSKQINSKKNHIITTVFEDAKIIKDETIEISTEKNINNKPKFTKLEAPLIRKVLIRLFKNEINDYLGIDVNEIEKFIDYCFHFKYKNRDEYEIHKFKTPIGDSTFFYELLKKLYPNESNINICRILSTCFDNGLNTSFGLDNLQTKIAYKNKYENSQVIKSIVETINSQIKPKKYPNK